MRTLLLTLAVGGMLTGCTKNEVKLKEVTVEQTAGHLKNGTATVLDANDDEYRQAAGVIPGAVLLTSFSAYDLKQLPPDKSRPLIFYCTSRF